MDFRNFANNGVAGEKLKNSATFLPAQLFQTSCNVVSAKRPLIDARCVSLPTFLTRLLIQCLLAKCVVSPRFLLLQTLPSLFRDDTRWDMIAKATRCPCVPTGSTAAVLSPATSSYTSAAGKSSASKSWVRRVGVDMREGETTRTRLGDAKNNPLCIWDTSLEGEGRGIPSMMMHVLKMDGPFYGFQTFGR